MSTAAPRILFYVQHLLGIGHLIRASRVADALAHAGFAVTIVTGGLAVPGFPGPAVRHVALTPLQAGRDGFATLCDAAGAPASEATLAARKNQLLRVLHETAPDIVITEAFPFGRRQMRFELLPLLNEANTLAPRPLIACSIRDILQASAKPGRGEETVEIVEHFYGLVLVHGDPRFARLEETFPLAGRFAGKIGYTGLVAGPPYRRGAGPFDVIVSAGGGAVGAELLQAALLARPATRLAQARWLMVAGPNLAQEAWDALARQAPPNVELTRFRADLPQLLAGARVSLSQAGYNTVCDLLRACVPAVVVPFAAGGETEQGERARRLTERGLAVTVASDMLSGAVVAQAIETALDRPAPDAAALDLDGAAATARLLRARLGSRAG